jgi:hypothetical protein
VWLNDAVHITAIEGQDPPRMLSDVVASDAPEDVYLVEYYVAQLELFCAMATGRQRAAIDTLASEFDLQVGDHAARCCYSCLPSIHGVRVMHSHR